MSRIICPEATPATINGLKIVKENGQTGAVIGDSHSLEINDMFGNTVLPTCLIARICKTPCQEVQIPVAMVSGGTCVAKFK